MDWGALTARINGLDRGPRCTRLSRFCSPSSVLMNRYRSIWAKAGSRALKSRLKSRMTAPPTIVCGVYIYITLFTSSYP